VTDPEEKSRALQALVEHIVPGRSCEVREPSAQELRGTSVLVLSLDESSAKVRTGPPVDDEDDYLLPVWAGELPLRLTTTQPIDDPRLAPSREPPPYVRAYRRPGASVA
jgi:hypothetical protein